jgi:hypothetical protein
MIDSATRAIGRPLLLQPRCHPGLVQSAAAGTTQLALHKRALAIEQLVPNHSLRKAMEQRPDEQPTLMMAIDPARLAVSEEHVCMSFMYVCVCVCARAAFVQQLHGRVVAGTLQTGRRSCGWLSRQKKLGGGNGEGNLKKRGFDVLP